MTRRKAFEVESIPLPYTQALGSYENDLHLKKLSHTSVVAVAVHFWSAGWPWLAISFKEDYNAKSLIPPSYPSLTNETNNFPCLQQDEVAYKK